MSTITEVTLLLLCVMNAFVVFTLFNLIQAIRSMHDVLRSIAKLAVFRRGSDES